MMPVKFYPQKPIETLEKSIVKDDGTPLYGEIDIYRRLCNDLEKSPLNWYIWHDLKLPEHSGNANYYKKSSSQIDFLILCKHGVLALEVKGGPISLKGNEFYYGKNFDAPIKQNPFKQAEGYKHTLKDNILNNIKKCFFCEAVAFPHVNYPFESKIFDKNLLWTPYVAQRFENSIENFLISVFEYSKGKHTRYQRNFGEISENEQSTIRKILSPSINDRSQINTINTLEWLGVQNTEILDGLSKNHRIMLEGPPGSGKTTLAKAFIDKQHNKSGIYLCWNNLLMNYTKSVLDNRYLSSEVEVTTFFKFVQKFNPELSYEKLTSLSELEFNNLLHYTICKLENEGRLLPYDFIVIDEAQDLFDRGLDLFLEKFSGFNGNGLTNGNFLVLYDIDQSYASSSRGITDLSDMLCTYCTHFKLNEVKRSAQNPDIRKLSREVIDNPKILEDSEFNQLFNGIKINFHSNLLDVKKHIVKNILTPIREINSSLNGQDSIILIESTFLRGTYKGAEDLRELLIIKDVEELTEKNLLDSSNKLRFTSILKFKGLESKNVFLVVSKPNEQTSYELFVGVTRAILNLEINIVG